MGHRDIPEQTPTQILGKVVHSYREVFSQHKREMNNTRAKRFLRPKHNNLSFITFFIYIRLVSLGLVACASPVWTLV